MTFTADQVWGLAVRADTLNDGYVKEDIWNRNSEAAFISKKANKALVKQWLRDGEVPTEEEVLKGREYRKFFNTYTMKALMGGLSSFESQALKIAQMDEFTDRNMLEFAIISCLPDSARREQARVDLKREIFISEQLPGNPGDAICAEIEVLASKYSPNYGKYRTAARLGESFVDFWAAGELKGTVRIRAKIKQHRENKTTQLNYVKVDRAVVR